MKETLVLEPEDSGTDSAPLIIKAYEKECPVLSGLKGVRDFVPHQGDIFKAKIGTVIASGDSIRQVFAAGKRQILARYPNQDSIDDRNGNFLYVEDEGKHGDKKSFQYGESSIKTWATPQEAEIVIFPGNNWTNNIIQGFDINRSSQMLVLHQKTSHPILKNNRYFFQNIFEELDSPGEWYFNKKDKELYFWPQNDLSLETVSIPVVGSIIEIRGKKLGKNYYGTPSNIRIEGFTMDGCEGSAIVIRDAEKTAVIENTIYNAGDNGIEIQNGYENMAAENWIYEIGGIGVKVSGGDQEKLIPSNNRIQNNTIHHIGRIIKNRAGVDCRGIGNIISHNLIYSTPRMGIRFDGNEHLIEYNHIYDVNRETQDSGIIYCSQIDWTKRGNVVQFNYLHDSGGFGFDKATGNWKTFFDTYGIYLDDWTSGTRVFGNIVENIASGGIFIHGGRDNEVENNIIIDGGRLGQMVYSAWLPEHPVSKKWLPLMNAKVRETKNTKYPRLATITDEKTGAKMSGNRFVRNIIYYPEKSSPLYGIFNDFDFTGTESDYNTIYNGGKGLFIPYLKKPPGMQWSLWKEKGLDRNSIVADPIFKDIDKKDYRLSSRSPALKKGFKPIPIDKIGLQRNQNQVDQVPREAFLMIRSYLKLNK
ncbi:MAG: right-handed parallel beta-helix repeat-containing protein [Thermodesulfobacteriota bacterium]